MVRFSEPAKRDLKQIHDYIARDSKFYAKEVTQSIVEKTESLEDFPKMGRVVPEIGDEYEIFPDGIEILAIIHGKRDFFGQFTGDS